MIDWLAALFTSGRAVDIVLGVMAAEALLLVARGQRWTSVLLVLLPGAFMLLGVRAALTGAPWWAVAVPLTLSFPVHVLDLHRRGLLARRRSGP